MPTEDKKPQSIFSHIIGWFKKAAEWVGDHLTDPTIAEAIREDLGLKPGQAIPPATAGKFAQYAAGLNPDKAALSETIAELSAIVPDLTALAKTFETDDFPANQIVYTILTLVATDSIRTRAPALFAFARAALFVEQDTESLMTLDPARLLRNARGVDLPSGEALAQRVATGGSLALQLIAMLTSSEPDKEKHGLFDIFSGWDVSPESVTPKADLVSTRATTFHIADPSPTSAGLMVTALAVPTAHGGPGLFLSLGGSLSVARDTDTMRFKLDAGFPSAFDSYIPFGDTSKLRFAAHTADVTPFFTFTMANITANSPSFRIGEDGGTRLDVYQTELSITVSKQTAGFHAALSDAELVIVAGQSGSFLEQIVGDGARVRFSVGLVVDSDGGLRLDGGTNAHVSLPIGSSLAGALTIHNLDLGLGPSSTGGDLGFQLSAGFTTTLGPFSATIDRLGFELQLDRRDNGNLGPFHLELGFKSPNGIGLALDSGMVAGGGYLFADPVNHEYAGALELKFGHLTLKAIGVVTDGNEGWSLLLLLYAQMTTGIQLGAGFTLNGVGGLVGVQRGVDEGKLALAIKTKAFDDILFPQNPVADAPRIINELRSFFPFSARSLTIGPMVDIGWGAPRILFIRAAILFQVNDVFHKPLGSWSLARVVLVGQLRLQLGSTKEDAAASVVKLTVDILGFWDLQQKKYGFLAALRDSKIATIDITGGLVVYGEYGDHDRFLLAAGGFNPRFKDVPAEAKASVDRLGAAFKVGRFKLKMTGYFALTPGTIQAGFDILAEASIGPVGLKGELGFDVIVYRDPATHFIADFRFNAAITYSGHTLAGVAVSGLIEGPGAWHIKGKVTFSILFWDISKSFDESWGQLPPTSVTTTDVRALLKAELTRPENWAADLPSSTAAMVTLAPRKGDTAPVAHPLSRLTFSQAVVPLGLTLDRFGDTLVSGTNRFDITKVRVGGQTVASPTMVREQFARAQFLNVSETDKLTKPSFEEIASGVEFSTTDYHISGSSLSFHMDVETVYLDIDAVRPGTTRPEIALTAMRPSHDLVQTLATQGAAAKAPQRLDERMSARTNARVNIAPAPLAVATRTTLATDASVALTGQAASVTMIAEQQLAPTTHASRSQLVERYELATP